MNTLLLLSVAALFATTPFSSTALRETHASSNDRVRKVLAVRVRTPISSVQPNRRNGAPYIATTTVSTTSSGTPSVTISPSAPQVVKGQNSFASQIEAAIFSLTNAERRNHNLPPLIADPVLAQIARAHSSDMLVHHYFNHTDLAGCDLSCRFAAGGYSYWSIGENIHTMSGYNVSASESAAHIVHDWMNSPGHRANILNTTFTHTGIGVAVEGSTIYSTTDFSRPR